MIKIQLKLKSFQQNSIEKALHNLKNILNFFSIMNYEKVNLPRKRKKLTVLRSPHIDKKSREQFEIQTCQSVLRFKLYDLKTANCILKILKNSFLIGVQLEISIQSLNYLKL